MERPPDHGRRGRVPWMGVLLAASLLTVWTPPGTAEPTVEPEPPNAAEGQDVLLRVRGVPESPLLYEWFRGATTESTQLIMSYKVESQTSTPGPANSSRETVRADGSLLIRNVTRADTGNYTIVVTERSADKHRAEGQLHVYQPVARPSIRASNTTVTEHEDCVVLACLTDDTGIFTLWLFNNQSLQPTERMKLSLDKDTLTIYPVGREDAGEYQCEVSNPVSASRSDPLTLTVKAGGNKTGLSTGAKTDIVIGVLVLVALAAALGCVLFVKSSGRTSSQHNPRVQQVQATTPGPGLSSHSATWTTRPDPRSPVAIYEELQDSSANIYCQINDKADVVS